MYSQIAPSLRTSSGDPARSWPRWPILVALWVLFLGPPAAALFIASGMPLAMKSAAAGGPRNSTHSATRIGQRGQLRAGSPLLVRSDGAIWLYIFTIVRALDHAWRSRRSRARTRHRIRSFSPSETCARRVNTS